MSVGRMARGWINSSDSLHNGRALVRDGKGIFALFLRMFVFCFPTITAGGCLGVCTGSPAAAGLGPLLFLPCRSERGRRRGVQRWSGREKRMGENSLCGEE